MKRFLSITLMFFVLAIAAKAQITGEIYDSDGYPIPLASAIYKGHHVAAASDMDGKFTIARHNGWELTFSSVGFIPQTIKVGPNTPSHMKIVLKEDSKTLGEVVIKQKRERYSRKNNPAVELMKRVIAAKKPGDSVIIIRDACVKANLGWNRDNYCPLHLARGFFV